MGYNRIVLDSGALSALAEKSRQARVAFNDVLLKGAEVVVPTAAIAEATTGDHRRDANVNRVLKATCLIDLDVRIARSAAMLRHASRRKGAGTIDAIVVATADMVQGSEVLTTDYRDLSLLASINGRTRIVAVEDVLRH